jgi:hypothetical protein
MRQVASNGAGRCARGHLLVAYHVDQLPAGTWTLRAFKWGSLAGMAEVTIVENGTTVQDFALTPR